MERYSRLIEPWRLPGGDFGSLLPAYRDAVALFDPGFNPGLTRFDEKTETRPYEYVRTTHRFGDKTKGISVVHTNECVEAGSITLSADTFEFSAYGTAVRAVCLTIIRPPNSGWHQCRVEIAAEGGPDQVEALAKWADAHFPAIHMSDDEIKGSLRTAVFSIMRGGWATGLRNIKPVLEQDPDNAQALLLAGIASAGLADYETAEAYLRRALSQEPDNVDALYNLGLCMVQKNSFDQALEYFERGLKVDPDNHSCWYELGRTLETLKRIPEAISAYRRAVELSPNPGGAFGYVGLDCTDQAKEALSRLKAV